METWLAKIISPSFVDDLAFLIAGKSDLLIKKILGKTGEMTLNLRTSIAVTYVISKIEAIPFSKTENQILCKQ